MTALNTKGEALEYASLELKGDREIVMKAVQKNALSFHYATPEVRTHRPLALEAVGSSVDWLRNSALGPLPPFLFRFRLPHVKVKPLARRLPADCMSILCSGVHSCRRFHCKHCCPKRAFLAPFCSLVNLRTCPAWKGARAKGMAAGQAAARLSLSFPLFALARVRVLDFLTLQKSHNSIHHSYFALCTLGRPWTPYAVAMH